MNLRTRLVAFAPLAVLSVAAGAGAVLGLRADGGSGTHRIDPTQAVSRLLAAPGANFAFSTDTASCPEQLDCGPNLRERGTIGFGPTRYDVVRTFVGDGDTELDGTFAFRGVAGDHFTKVDDCWAAVPPSMRSTPTVGLAVLTNLTPAGRAPATDILELLGLPQLLWETYGFSPELQAALATATLPVDLVVDDRGAVSLRLDGRSIARTMARELPGADIIALSQVANQVAAWTAAPIDDAPEITEPPDRCGTGTEAP